MLKSIDVKTIDIDKIIESFVVFLKNEKKSSKNTIDAYIRDLSNFKSFFEYSKFESIFDVSTENLEDYRSFIQKKGLSPSSVCRNFSAVRSLFQFLVTQGLLKSNPAKNIHNEKIEKKGPQILTNKEIELLLSSPSSNDVKGIRDKAMLEVLYATGIKVSELISLNVEDVNLQLNFVRCSCGEKERFIPLYPLALKALNNYLDMSRKLLIIDEEENALFVNVSGDRMTRQGCWKIIKGYAQTANISKSITPHTLRHSFAAHLLENGADIHEIQEILGHSDISSTQRYAQFLKDKVKTSYIKFHPRAQ